MYERRLCKIDLKCGVESLSIKKLFDLNDIPDVTNELGFSNLFFFFFFFFNNLFLNISFGDKLSL